MHIAIIIPCYNEADRLNESEIVAFYENHRHISFFLVNDGSLDGTLEKLHKIAAGRDDRIQVVNCRQNRGKAEAVRKGTLMALSRNTFHYVGYFDADLATPLNEIMRLAAQGKAFIMGSRVKLLGRKIHRVWYRHYLGRFFATVVDCLFKLPIYDTQCGAKLIEASLAKEIFAQPFVSRWLLDIELITRARKVIKHKKLDEIMVEVPLLEWIDKGNSRIKVLDLFRLPYELIKIRLTQ